MEFSGKSSKETGVIGFEFLLLLGALRIEDVDNFCSYWSHQVEKHPTIIYSSYFENSNTCFLRINH
jgi:hypothetical protein